MSVSYIQSLVRIHYFLPFKNYKTLLSVIRIGSTIWRRRYSGEDTEDSFMGGWTPLLLSTYPYLIWICTKQKHDQMVMTDGDGRVRRSHPLYYLKWRYFKPSRLYRSLRVRDIPGYWDFLRRSSESLCLSYKDGTTLEPQKNQDPITHPRSL